ncbi:MAG TPA: 4Fe-4S dicluster domain-containing protein [Polyangia bacterium]|jgi:Fe-S-cluster-containing dehydrogenase component
MTLSRRSFFKFLGASAGAVGAGALVAKTATAAGPATARAAQDNTALLIDTTKCKGCRGCEAACAEANHLPGPSDLGQETALDKNRKTDTEVYSVLNKRTKAGKTVFVKQQCMHCVEPACASACLAKALKKTPEGAVIYNEKVCIGCRYCMVACPFEIPRFEYAKALPYIKKCQLCYERQKQGKPIACASVCPTGALKFGKRAELLEEARGRIYRNPDNYVHHIYGEHEVGGTNVLYLASVPFEELGFKMDLGDKSYARLSSGALAAVPFILTIGAPLLMGLYAATKVREAGHDEMATAAPDQKEDHHG